MLSQEALFWFSKYSLTFLGSFLSLENRFESCVVGECSGCTFVFFWCSDLHFILCAGGKCYRTSLAFRYIWHRLSLSNLLAVRRKCYLRLHFICFLFFLTHFAPWFLLQLDVSAMSGSTFLVFRSYTDIFRLDFVSWNCPRIYYRLWVQLQVALFSLLDLSNMVFLSYPLAVRGKCYLTGCTFMHLLLTLTSLSN